MKKMLILTVLSVSLFGMDQESNPNNQILQEKYQELQGKYEPQVNFFSNHQFSTFSTEKPLTDITASLNLAPSLKAPESSEEDYKERRVMSYGFEPKQLTSFEEIFNMLKKRDPQSMKGVDMSEFTRKEEVSKDKKIMIWQNEKSNFPVAIVEYLNKEKIA